MTSFRRCDSTSFSQKKKHQLKPTIATSTWKFVQINQFARCIIITSLGKHIKLTVLPSVSESKPWLTISLVYPVNFCSKHEHLRSWIPLKTFLHGRSVYGNHRAYSIFAATPSGFPTSYKTTNHENVRRLTQKEPDTREWTASNMPVRIS